MAFGTKTLYEKDNYFELFLWFHTSFFQQLQNVTCKSFPKRTSWLCLSPVTFIPVLFCFFFAHIHISYLFIRATMKANTFFLSIFFFSVWEKMLKVSFVWVFSGWKLCSHQNRRSDFNKVLIMILTGIVKKRNYKCLDFSFNMSQ